MIALADTIPAPLARWSARLGFFAVVLVVLTGVLHRAASLPTAVALNAFVAAFAVATFALLFGLIAAIQIWHSGRTGTWQAVWGLIFSVGIFLWPALVFQTARGLPPIYDISTDLKSPPKFKELAKGRGAGAHSANYPGDAFARQQSEAYPDLRTVTIDRPAEETFEIIAQLVRSRRGLGWKIMNEEPPSQRNGRTGLIEAVERTLVLGFYDDVAIRVADAGKQSRIDIRSASRFGRHDLGTNASRVRRFVRELQSRLDLSVPGVVAWRGQSKRAAALVPKRQKGQSAAQAAQKAAQDRARPTSQRARERKARQLE